MTFAAGSKIRANDLNLTLSPPCALLKQTATQSLANNSAATPLVLHTEAYANNMTTDITTGRITVIEDGIYLVSAMVAFAASLTGRRFVQIYVNGSAIAQTLSSSQPGSGVWRVPSATYGLELVAGDYIHLHGFQDTGAAMTLPAEAFLQATYISPLV